LGAATLGALGCTGADPYYRFTTQTKLVRCNVTRQECATVNDSGPPGEFTCLTLSDNQDIVGDVCVEKNDTRTATDVCKAKFCTNDHNAPGFCAVTAAQATPSSPECSDLASGYVQLKDVRVHSEHIALEDFYFGAPTTIVDDVLGTDADPPICVPPLIQPLTFVWPDGVDFSAAVSIGEAIPNSPDCTAPSSEVYFTLRPGTMATASGGGTTALLSALRGDARIGRVCGDGVCIPKTLDAFEADLADITISGTKLSKIHVQSVVPAPIVTINDPDGAVPGIAAGALRLRLDGLVNGVDSLFTFVNSTSMRLDPSSSFRLYGRLVAGTLDSTGSPVTINIDVNANGTPATPAALACLNESGLDRVFGFEDPSLWTSTQAQLSLVTSPLTQGCGALGVQGSGFLSLAGAPFTTRGLATNSALSVDLFVPTGQPNPSYTGALQAYLSCPSGSVFNQYIGQVELTGKPVGHYSTLRFPLPSAVRTALARPLDDCAFTLALNVNATGNTWLLDQLRFTP
jgi:hypothetical protein